MKVGTNGEIGGAAVLEDSNYQVYYLKKELVRH